MKALTILFIFLLMINPVFAKELITDTSVVSSGGGYQEYSFKVLSDFTMIISGSVDGNLTLFILSNTSFNLFLQQQFYTSYSQTIISDDYDLRFETGNFIDVYLHIVLSNLSNLTVTYSISIQSIEETRDEIGTISVFAFLLSIFFITVFKKSKRIS